jgi:hypothetical protein
MTKYEDCIEGLIIKFEAKLFCDFEINKKAR